MKKYRDPRGLEGIGSDVKWCARIKGRKKCALCFKYAELEKWKKDWHWFYLLRWKDWAFFDEHSHFKRWGKMIYSYYPINYRSTGLKDYELRAILKKGCSNNKKCRCSSIVQRAFWHCEECYKLVNSMAVVKRCHPHDIMLLDRTELKTEVLILKISGSI